MQPVIKCLQKEKQVSTLSITQEQKENQQVSHSAKMESNPLVFPLMPGALSSIMSVPKHCQHQGGASITCETEVVSYFLV